MSEALRLRIFEELDSVVLIDPHTHINALQPASSTLADILGYHYYTELAHSAGVPKEQLEEPGLDPKEKCGRLFANLAPLQNTIQYAIVKCSGRVISRADLPIEFRNKEANPSKRGPAQKLNADAVKSALLKTGGNKARAARILGVGRATLYRFLDANSGILSDLNSL